MNTNNGQWTMRLAAGAVIALGMFTTARADHDDWEDRRERQQDRADDAIERQRDRADDWYDAAEDALERDHRQHRRANWFGDWNDDLYHGERERLDHERDQYEDHLDRLEDRHDRHHGATLHGRPPVPVWAGHGYGVPRFEAPRVQAPRVQVQVPLHTPHPPHCHCGRCEVQRLSFWFQVR